MTATISRHVIPPRAEVLDVPLAYHGAIDYAELEELGLHPDAVLDFSVNSNPYGPSPTVWETLPHVPLDRYPDREALALRRALADHLGFSPSQIMAGNGTAEILALVALAFLQPGDRVLVVGPTFGEYARSSRLMGARVEAWNARQEQEFAVQPKALAQKLKDLAPRLVFLCRPNNPTGHILPLEVLAEWASSHPQTLFIVDEAYLAFAAGCPSALVLGAANILVLRSMTKDYALAGLRLGYAVGHKQIVSSLARVRPPWNVNALAQAAGEVALADQTHLRQSLEKLAQARDELVSKLKALGLSPLPSAVHFFLVPVKDGSAFRRTLLRQGILVRLCDSFGLPTYVRIATRRPEENIRLVAAIRETRADDAG